MDVNTTSNAAQAKSYEPVSSSVKTDKVETHSAPSYAPEEEKSSLTPKDTLEISEAAQNSDKVKNKNKDNWKDFDMDAFQSGIRDKLMESINLSKDALKAAGVEFAKYNSDSILYDLSGLNNGEKIQAADVPEYWNAENTSQRIVDFAMSFSSLSGLSDEEYINQMRAAVEEGYRQAKSILGDLPGSSAQLFNDTYNLTMQKFDELLEQAKAKNGITA